MEKVLSNGFFEMTSEEMDMVTGGGVWQALAAFGDAVDVAVSIVLVATGAGLLTWACQ